MSSRKTAPIKPSDLPMKWFKLWTEARNDGKLRALSDYQHRTWFRLLCYAAEQEPAGTVRATWKLLAAECADGAVEQLKSAVTEFESLQLVTCVTCNENEVTISFPSFFKRQAKFASDDRKRVAERVAKHRALKKLRQQTFLVTSGNEEVSRKNDPETETEEEEIPPNAPRRGDRRRKVSVPFVPPDWVPGEDWEAFVEMRGRIRKPPTERAKELVVKELDRLRGLGHQPGDVLRQSVRNSWQDVFPIRDPATRNGRAEPPQPPLEFHRKGRPLP